MSQPLGQSQSWAIGLGVDRYRDSSAATACLLARARRVPALAARKEGGVDSCICMQCNGTLQNLFEWDCWSLDFASEPKKRSPIGDGQLLNFGIGIVRVLDQEMEGRRFFSNTSPRLQANRNPSALPALVGAFTFIRHQETREQDIKTSRHPSFLGRHT